MSLGELTAEDFTARNYSDLFAAIFVLFSTVSLMTLPLYMLYILWVNFETLDTQGTREMYEFIYTDLNVRTFYQAIFHVIYLVRRSIFVFILVYFESYNGFQLVLNTILTVGYI